MAAWRRHDRSHCVTLPTRPRSRGRSYQPPIHWRSGGAAGLDHIDARQPHHRLRAGRCPRRGACGLRRGSLDHHRAHRRPNAHRAGIALARRGVRRAPRVDDLRAPSSRSRICCCHSRPISAACWRFRLVSGLASGTFIPLTIGFVVLNLPPRMVIYGVAAYAMNLELSLNIAASIEGWFCDNWSWQWIFWDTALLAPLMLVCIYFGMPRQTDQPRAAQDRGLGRHRLCRSRVQPALCRARPGQPARLAEFRPDQRAAAGRRQSCSSPSSCRSSRHDRPWINLRYRGEGQHSAAVPAARVLSFRYSFDLLHHPAVSDDGAELSRDRGRRRADVDRACRSS